MRSRETIQSEIDALQAELAGSQPVTLKVANKAESGGLELYVAGSEAYVSGGRDEDDGARTNFIGYFEPGVLRDWLNYHFPFPKTEETI